MQHHCGVFANGIQHYRILKFGNDLANDVDALGLQLFEMREIVCGHRFIPLFAE
jgi:hypothetical protein